DASQLNFESTQSFTLRIRISDGSLSDELSLAIGIADVNESPSISGATTISLDEHIDDGTLIHTLSAQDPDAGSSLIFSLASGNTGAAFSIDGLSGEIRVNDSRGVDFETTP